MSDGIKKRFNISTTTRSVLVGMGSIFSLVAIESPPTPRALAHADRDAQSLRSDWNRIGQDFRTAMDRTRRQKGKRY